MKQLADHILILLDHGNADTVTGNVTCILAEGTLTETGFGGDLFKMPHLSITWTEHTWLRNTLLGMEHSKLCIQHMLPSLQQWKQQDSFIMPTVLSLQIYSPHEMELINEV